jgi:predicted DNA-binding protein
VNDKNVAVRIPWELWKYLDIARATRQIETNKTTTLSEIVREALEKYVGDTWTEKQKNEQK